MSNQDLRVFLQDFTDRFPGEVMRVEERLDPRYEATAIVLQLEKAGRRPVVIFERIGDSKMPVVANVLATRERLAMGLGVPAGELPQEYAQRIKRRISPQRMERPPFLDHVITGDDVDLTRLPVLTHFPIDAGPYITAGLVVARDPLTGVDTCGYHRMQFKDKRKLGISLHSRQRLWEYHRRAEEKGVSLEAAVVLCVHPNISLGSMALVPYDQGKFERMGGLFGEPLQVTRCVTVDLEVPAWAEIVIEGEILSGVREPEGPFAEFTGYACHRSTENVFIPRAMLFRDGARYQCITPGMCAEHNTIVAVQREGDVLRSLRETLPNVVNVHAPLSACGLFHCYVSIKKRAEGQPLQAILAAFAVDHNLKLVIVVDDDIDVLDETRVLWAVATRLQADRGMTILPQHQGMGCTLDPSTDEQSRSAKMGIDATMPLDGFAPSIAMDRQAGEKALRLLQKYL